MPDKPDKKDFEDLDDMIDRIMDKMDIDDGKGDSPSVIRSLMNSIKNRFKDLSEAYQEFMLLISESGQLSCSCIRCRPKVCSEPGCEHFPMVIVQDWPPPVIKPKQNSDKHLYCIEHEIVAKRRHMKHLNN